MTSVNDLNLDDILQNWAENMGEYCNNELQFNLSELKFYDDSPTFRNRLQSQGSPKMQVIFEDVFRNDTDYPQKHRIRCERQTTSFAKFDLTQGIVYEHKHLLKVYDLPQSIGEASGCTTPMTMSQLGSDEFMEKLIWAVDDEITVAPRSVTRAEVIVSEKVQETAFQIKTKIRENVHCDVVDVQDDSVFTSIDGDIYEILQQHKKENGNVRDLGLRNGIVSFISKGTCKFRYGVSKMISLHNN